MVTPFVKLYEEQPYYNSLEVFGYINGNNKASQKTYLVCSLGTTTYTKDIDVIIPLQ